MISNHPAIGFWQCYHRIRSMGHRWNHKWVYRVYTALKLNIRSRAKKRLPTRAKQELFQLEGVNQVWSLDFMHDSLWNERSFRMLKVSPEVPEMIRVDNGPEFISQKLDKWCRDNDVTLAFIHLGKPTSIRPNTLLLTVSEIGKSSIARQAHTSVGPTNGEYFNFI